MNVPTGAFVARRNGKVFVTGNSGFPKSLDISKAIDKAAGAEREVVGQTSAMSGAIYDGEPDATGSHIWSGQIRSNVPITPEAQQWDGWGSAIKPAHEPVVLARKPLAGTIASTVLEYGTGGLNVDGCRLPGGKNVPASAARDRIGQIAKGDEKGRAMDTQGFDPNVGRWPPNVLLSPETAAKLGDKASYFPVFDYGDEDRFFYAPKASREEREAGCEHLPGRTGAEAVDRKPGSAGANNPRAGAGRENGKGAGVKVRNFHPT